MNKRKIAELVSKFEKEKLNIPYKTNQNSDFTMGYFSGYADAVKDIYNDYIKELIEPKKKKRGE